MPFRMSITPAMHEEIQRVIHPRSTDQGRLLEQLFSRTLQFLLGSLKPAVAIG
jgi:hypothetical protein